LVRTLTEEGADVNRADDGMTPLFIAAREGHEAVVRALLGAGADINRGTDDGKTPLSVATTPISNGDQGEHAAIVQILMVAGAV
jgi:ankyrin repeat protein